MDQRALVLGASGYVGSHLVPALMGAGFHVRAAARRVDVLRGRGWKGIELVAADAFDPDSLRVALRGIDIAFYLVHSMGSGKEFAQLDREAAANFARAAAEEHITRIVYLGGLQPEEPVSEHLASRRETGLILRASGVPVTEVRAGIVVGPGSAAFEVIRDLTYHLPVMITPRWVRSRTQPIALSDLVAYLVRLSTLPEAEGRTLDVGGPEVISYGNLMRQFAEVAGKRVPKLIAVPILTPRLSSYWLDLVTSVPASIARPLVEGLRHDLIANDAEARAMAPMELHSYRQAVTEALETERQDVLAARWAEGSLAFRGYNPEVSYYSKGATTRFRAEAPAEAVWDVVCRIGGKNGYFFANGLWQLRGAMDRLVGGVGLRRGRRHPADIRVGDAIDFWRVAAIEPGRRLTLVAEMRLPGIAVLEFEVIAGSEATSELITTARFHPGGMPGLLYWYLVLPFHGLIFDRMPQSIIRNAERALSQPSMWAGTTGSSQNEA